MLFDFDTYLSTPKQVTYYAVETLTGGVVNVTVRASKKNGPKRGGGGLFPNDGSMVLKYIYAPPHVAAAGEEAPMRFSSGIYSN